MQHSAAGNSCCQPAQPINKRTRPPAWSSGFEAVIDVSDPYNLRRNPFGFCPRTGYFEKYAATVGRFQKFVRQFRETEGLRRALRGLQEGLELFFPFRKVPGVALWRAMRELAVTPIG